MSNSYKQIFKSTSLIGGASLISMLLSIVKMKFAAVLLGASGVGLLSTFTNLTGMFGDLASLGIGSSGVRQIAEAVSQGNEEKTAEVVKVYRRLIWLTSGLGILLMIGLASTLSVQTFGSTEYKIPIIILSASLLLTGLSNGQSCLIQAMRRILELSKIKIFGTLCGCFATLICFWLWGADGIVPALLISAALMLLFSSYYATKIKIIDVRISFRKFICESWQLITLGVCFMISGLVASGGAYIQKILLIREFDLTVCGIYQAGYMLSGVLVGFVLNAMGADYYPRLTGLVHLPDELQKAVDEQLEISLVLSFPGLLLMMLFAPVIIYVFYSSAFQSSVLLLQIFTFGVLGRVFSWPLGYLIMAHGNGILLIVSEVFSGILHLCLFYLGLKLWGVQGAAWAFCALYLIYGLYLMVIAKCKYHIRVCRKNIFLAIGMALIMSGMFGWLQLVPNPVLRWSVGVSVSMLCGLGCLSILIHRLGKFHYSRVNDIIKKVKLWQKKA